jgi:hypothetical protein
MLLCTTTSSLPFRPVFLVARILLHYGVVIHPKPIRLTDDRGSVRSPSGHRETCPLVVAALDNRPVAGHCRGAWAGGVSHRCG